MVANRIALTAASPLAIGAFSQQADTTSAVPSATAPMVGVASAITPTGIIQEIVNYEVDPAVNVIWQACSTTVTSKGTEEYRPVTDREWHEVRRRAIVLAEAEILLSVPGRRVAKGASIVRVHY